MGKKILFYDSEWNGHHSEFILHLIDFFEKTLDDYTNCQVFFLLHPNLKTKTKHAKKCQVRYLESTDIDIINKKQHPLIRGCREWKTLGEYIDKSQINHVFLLYIDLYLLKIGLLKKQNFSISGIQFLPYFRMPQGSKRQRLRRIWSFWKIKWATRNKYLKTVFILNDNLSVNELNRLQWHNKVFRYLPDPINLLKEEVNLNNAEFLKKINDLQNKRLTLLVFGHISMRKNIEKIIEALSSINSETRAQLQLLIVGEVAPTYKVVFEKMIQNFSKEFPTFPILRIEKFVTIREMNHVFEQSDYLLIPYTNSYKSSGIIGLAAKHNKLIIGPNTGIMHDLIQDYKLGLTVNPYDVQEMKEAIIKISKFEKRNAKFKQYTRERMPSRFAKRIMDSIMNDN